MTVATFSRSVAGKRRSLLDALRETFAPDEFGQRRLADLWAKYEAEGPDSPLAGETAASLAVAVGYSLCFGSKPRLLPASAAAAALRHLRDRLPVWTREVTTTPIHEDVAYLRIRLRSDVWALMEAARRTEAELQDRGDAGATAVSDAFEAVWQPLDEFDTALEAGKPVLASLLETGRVRALRARLSAEYRVSLPWWLDPKSYCGMR